MASRTVTLKTKRNIQLQKLRTSIVLETAIWEAISDILLRENLDLDGFCQQIDKCRRGINLTSAIRVVVVVYYTTLIKTGMSNSKSQNNYQLSAPDPSSSPVNLFPVVLKSCQNSELRGQ